MFLRISIYIDHNNFEANIKHINSDTGCDRVIDYHNISKFVKKYLSNNLQYKDCKLTYIRTFLYTGEYTDSLIKKIKSTISSTSGEKKKEFEKLLGKTERRKDGQRAFIKKASTFYFFEIRQKPLQFSENKGIFQKGVDVQLAVDLVSDAFKNIYDVAVLFSGDIDLLESVRNIKSLGKQVIIFSHYKNIAEEMKKEADMYVNLQFFKKDQLNEFSHEYQKHE